MNIRSIFRILGILITLLSLTLVPPLLVALIYPDSGGLPLVESFIITLTLGGSLWYRYREHK
ncbi:MAG: potassium transporter, partial [Gammaproteobacteria bacterium]|nr:potassium transporter [Gammaproteobacteria bacterium]NNJ73001.1 potassium transporter [Enterobacterales bacterium]